MTNLKYNSSENVITRQITLASALQREYKQNEQQHLQTCSEFFDKKVILISIYLDCGYISLIYLMLAKSFENLTTLNKQS